MDTYPKLNYSINKNVDSDQLQAPKSSASRATSGCVLRQRRRRCNSNASARRDARRWMIQGLVSQELLIIFQYEYLNNTS